MTTQTRPVLAAATLDQARRQRAEHQRAQFTIPKCGRCDRVLADRHGNPSWEILNDEWVCREACVRARQT